MFVSLFHIALQEATRSNIPWWVWLILIVILLVILWFWFGREEEAAPQIEPVSEGTGEQPETGPEAPVEPDDLKRIEGIGPKVARLLNESGIMTFAQLSEVDLGKLEEILDTAKLQYMDPSTWADQAKLAAAGEWEALEKLQDDLKGGKR